MNAAAGILFLMIGLGYLIAYLFAMFSDHGLKFERDRDFHLINFAGADSSYRFKNFYAVSVPGIIVASISGGSAILLNEYGVANLGTTLLSVLAAIGVAWIFAGLASFECPWWMYPVKRAHHRADQKK